MLGDKEYKLELYDCRTGQKSQYGYLQHHIHKIKMGIFQGWNVETKKTPQAEANGVDVEAFLRS